VAGIKGGIIAAGLGERFQNRGVATPKALLSVAGQTLLERTLAQFCEAGIRDLTLIFNETHGPLCIRFIEEHFPDLKPDIIVKTTKSSFESFCEVSARIGAGPLLMTTIDSIYHPATLSKLLRRVETFPPGATVLGLTSFIDDEKPLYAQVAADWKIRSLGETRSAWVTSGVYWFPDRPRGLDKSYPALRGFLADLIQRGLPVYGFDLGHSVDVDRPEDLTAAEAFVSSFS